MSRVRTRADSHVRLDAAFFAFGKRNFATTDVEFTPTIGPFCLIRVTTDRPARSKGHRVAEHHNTMNLTE